MSNSKFLNIWKINCNGEYFGILTCSGLMFSFKEERLQTHMPCIFKAWLPMFHLIYPKVITKLSFIYIKLMVFIFVNKIAYCIGCFVCFFASPHPFLFITSLYYSLEVNSSYNSQLRSCKEKKKQFCRLLLIGLNFFSFTKWQNFDQTKDCFKVENTSSLLFLHFNLRLLSLSHVLSLSFSFSFFFFLYLFIVLSYSDHFIIMTTF